ncbi:hypothetical protein N7540_005756 [Penicillium herquei]|nr:hypothetical protein N7540_005756 [Penicillium herquei]
MVSNTAIIVIVLVASLGSVSLAAALFGTFIDNEGVSHRDPSLDQRQYMREVRLRTLELLEAESRIRYPKVSKSRPPVDANQSQRNTMSEYMDDSIQT